jgi:hypothetical protein
MGLVPRWKVNSHICNDRASKLGPTDIYWQSSATVYLQATDSGEEVAVDVKGSADEPDTISPEKSSVTPTGFTPLRLSCQWVADMSFSQSSNSASVRAQRPRLSRPVAMTCQAVAPVSINSLAMVQTKQHSSSSTAVTVKASNETTLISVQDTED